MRIFSGLRRRQVSAPAISIPEPHPDILWGEIACTIGAADIQIRSGDDVSIIVLFPGYGSFKCESGKPKQFLKDCFPSITDAHLTRALRYFNNRVAAKRRQDDDDLRTRHAEPKRKWRDTSYSVSPVGDTSWL